MSKQLLKSLLIIAVGISISSFGIINFAVNSSLASGGVAGIGIIIFHLFGISTGLTNLLINIPLLIIYYRFTDRRTFFLTIYGIVMLSATLRLFEFIGPLVPDLSNDMTLAAIGFGVTVGIGMGLTLRAKGTTGGSVIVAKLAQDLKQIPVEKTMVIFDTVVIIASLFLFLNFIDAIYSLLSVYIFSVVIRKMQEGFANGYKILIFSDRHEEICQVIHEKLKRGLTLISATGGYSKDTKTVVLAIIDRKQLNDLKKLIHEIDPESFVSVSHTYETLGEGFTFEQNNKLPL